MRMILMATLALAPLMAKDSTPVKRLNEAAAVFGEIMATVRDYLTQQGMASSSVTTKGFGKTQPVASNDTPQGRQQNRRVELVISGDVIGTEIGKVIALK
jgi:hypothetical protein